jgi:hypothetical protein
VLDAALLWIQGCQLNVTRPVRQYSYLWWHPHCLEGDFLQTLPVVKHGNQSLTIHACILSSPLWPTIAPNVLKLHQNMHLTSDPVNQEFALWLRQLVRGDLDDNDMVQLPPFLLCPLNRIAELINHFYPNINMHQDDQYFLQHCILCPHNVNVHIMNDIVLQFFPGPVHEMWPLIKCC